MMTDPAYPVQRPAPDGVSAAARSLPMRKDGRMPAFIAWLPGAPLLVIFIIVAPLL